jgi:Ca2+-binding RTX toxin-like protein
MSSWGTGSSSVYGGMGSDTIIGGGEADLIYDGGGDDYLEAGDGNSTVVGEGGNNTIIGGAGSDTIGAGAGNESIVGRRAELKARPAWAAVFVVLLGQMLFVMSPAFAYGQPDATPTTACANKFPYRPEQFLEKFLALTGESDPYTVPATFQHIFEMKLSHAIVRGTRVFSYDAMPCEWYTHVHIMTLSDSRSGTRVFLSIGDLPQPLLFVDSEREKCLSVDLVTKSMEASGWRGGSLEGSYVVWGYRKGSVLVNLQANGRKTPYSPECVTNITVNYK